MERQSNRQVNSLTKQYRDFLLKFFYFLTQLKKKRLLFLYPKISKLQNFDRKIIVQTEVLGRFTTYGHNDIYKESDRYRQTVRQTENRQREVDRKTRRQKDG